MMKTSGHRLRWAHVIIVVSFILAIGLRTYKWNDFTVFNGDDGMDLSVIWNMEYEAHRPLVGPFLSAPGIYTPPTYYYLTWFFYHLAPSPNGVRIGYLFMDIVNMAIIVYLAFRLGNRNAAAVTSILYAVSRVFIYHGRAYWQPFPMQIFLSLMLLFLWLAYRKKSHTYLWSASGCYAVALSVYPSPLILLPLVIHHTTNWYRKIKQTPTLPAFGKSLMILGCTAAYIFLPQIIFEYRRGFPTFHALIAIKSSPFAPIQFVETVLSHVGISVTNFIQTRDMLPESSWLIIPGTYLFLLILTHRMNLQKTTNNQNTAMTLTGFFPPLIILLGYCFTYFIGDLAHHRVWAVMPVFILVTALIVEKAFRSGPKTIAAACALLLVYLSGNLLSVHKDFTLAPVDAIGLTHHIAQAIVGDMNTSMIPQEKTTLVYVTPDNTSEHYQLNRILYWLIASGSFHIPLAADGNSLDYDVYMPEVIQPTVYLLCEKFMTPEKTNTGCLAPFMKMNQSYIPTFRIDNPELSLIALKKQNGKN